MTCSGSGISGSILDSSRVQSFWRYSSAFRRFQGCFPMACAVLRNYLHVASPSSFVSAGFKSAGFSFAATALGRSSSGCCDNFLECMRLLSNRMASSGSGGRAAQSECWQTTDASVRPRASRSDLATILQTWFAAGSFCVATKPLMCKLTREEPLPDAPRSCEALHM